MAHPGGHGGQEVEKARVDGARRARTQVARAAEDAGRPDRPQAQADRRSNPPKGSDIECVAQLATGQAQDSEVNKIDPAGLRSPLAAWLGDVTRRRGRQKPALRVQI
jgi:hypothetical protein